MRERGLKLDRVKVKRVNRLSLSTRERGLKHQSRRPCLARAKSLPMRERGLKPRADSRPDDPGESLPTREDAAASEFMLAAAPCFLVFDEMLELIRHLSNSEINWPFGPIASVSILETARMARLNRVCTQLLAEKGHSGLFALPTDVPRPLQIEGGCSRATFSANDHPVDSLEGKLDGLEERLHRESSRQGGNSTQLLHSPESFGRGDAGHRDQVRWPMPAPSFQPSGELRHPIRPFAQPKPDVTPSGLRLHWQHDFLEKILERDRVRQGISHIRNEDHTRLAIQPRLLGAYLSFEVFPFGAFLHPTGKNCRMVEVIRIPLHTTTPVQHELASVAFEGRSDLLDRFFAQFNIRHQSRNDSVKALLERSICPFLCQFINLLQFSTFISGQLSKDVLYCPDKLRSIGPQLTTVTSYYGIHGVICPLNFSFFHFGSQLRAETPQSPNKWTPKE